MQIHKYKNRIKNNRGMAMIMTLFFSVVLILISGVFSLRVTTENRMVNKEIELQKTFYAAQSGANLALSKLNTFINTDLLTTISNSYPNNVIKYTQKKVNQNKSIVWLVNSVRKNGDKVFIKNGDQAEYSSNGTINDQPYQCNIIITPNGDPSDSGVDTWDLPFFYKITTTAGSDDITQDIYLSGDFTVRVRRDNFAKYALFTNEQTTPAGTDVWFTNRTNFSGPVHSNDRFNFALNPGGIFEGAVTQEELTARFYNYGSPILLDADANGNIDVPTFNTGMTRDVEEIELASPVQEQDMVDQAKGGKNLNQNGIHIPADGNTLCGGIYVRGNGTISLSTQGANPVYTISSGTSSKRITIDHAQNQTTVEDLKENSTHTYDGVPNGEDDAGTLIFVDGNVLGLSGTVQSNEEVTISTSDDIVINDHLRYETYTPAVGSPGDIGYVSPSAAGATNLLGLVSWNGDVRIGTSAPNNVDVHATILAKQGVYTVDNYDNTWAGTRGVSTLLGGVMSDRYGAFGLFNGVTGQSISGYGRNFVYDDRMITGSAPPYFPTLKTFIAFTNDLTDKIVWQEGE